MINVHIQKNTLKNIRKQLIDGNEMQVGFLTGIWYRDNIKILDIVIPEQDRDFYTTHIPLTAQFKILKEVIKNNNVVVGIAIYQPNFPLFLSDMNKALLRIIHKNSKQLTVGYICNIEKKDMFVVCKGKGEIISEPNIKRRY